MTPSGHIAYAVEDRGHSTPCHVWQRCVSKAGDSLPYGLYVAPNGKLGPAHRFAYVAARGPIQEGFVLDHLCRVPGCVNPDHLEPVTQAVNVRRAITTKLTEEKATEIRNLYAETGMSQQNLADRFGVSRSLVSMVLDTKRWAGIDTVVKGQSKRERLTGEQVQQVRNLLDSGMLQKDIAAQFGVSRSLVSMILSGKHR